MKLEFTRPAVVNFLLPTTYNVRIIYNGLDMKYTILTVIVCLLAFASGCKKANTIQAQPTEANSTAAAQGEQTTCPVMGGPIDKNVKTEYQGKTVYFCCPGCVDTFKADPNKYLDKLPQFKR